MAVRAIDYPKRDKAIDRGRKAKKRANAYETFKTVVGEIGIPRHEYLYKMQWWEILLTIQGYRRRNVLQYQLQRITAWASAFCMGNKNNVQPQDFLHLYIDDYTSDGEDNEISDDEIEEIRRQIEAENEARAKKKK